jgi:hypothetical protein
VLLEPFVGFLPRLFSQSLLTLIAIRHASLLRFPLILGLLIKVPLIQVLLIRVPRNIVVV